MASPSAYETEEAMLAPSGEGEPATGVPSVSSLDPNVDPREILGTHGENSVSQGPGPQDSPQPQDPNQGAASVEGNRAILGLSFPKKLWMIVEDDTFTSVCWNDDGDAVVIEKDLFQTEVLSRKGAERIFETDSLKSFIRLLNLYGFSKIRPNDPSVCSPGNRTMMIYRHCNFQRQKPLLVENIKRKCNLMIITCPGTSVTIPKRKKEVTPTRRSQRIQLKKCTNEADKRAQKEGTNARGRSGTRSFILPDTWFMGNIAGHAMEDPSSSEPGGPSAEGTSSNVMFVPRATAERDGAGKLPTPPPDHSSVMSLYNSCYSFLLAALSVKAPQEAPEEDEEEEGASDYKRVLCEHIKDSPIP
ncbi:heat shock transcription factor, X-linked member 3 [Rhinolophus sinicus]|uniref:heat shock transcription factor, X-linked member 3 n=1 Tax=Rhinolophus sinicus TaxID=89399 RepID=UPI003D7C1221